MEKKEKNKLQWELLNKRKTENIILRISASDKEEITKNAKECRLSTSEYLIQLGKKKIVKPHIGPELFKHTDQLRYYGNNINQLVKLIHSNKTKLNDININKELISYIDKTNKLLEEVKQLIFFKM